jgi:hypothetical protein
VFVVEHRAQFVDLQHAWEGREEREGKKWRKEQVRKEEERKEEEWKEDERKEDAS